MIIINVCLAAVGCAGTALIVSGVAWAVCNIVIDIKNKLK